MPQDIPHQMVEEQRQQLQQQGAVQDCEIPLKPLSYHCKLPGAARQLYQHRLEHLQEVGWRTRRAEGSKNHFFRELKKLLCYGMTAKTMLAAICRRLGFTFALARRVGWAAIWECDSGFINWILVNLQQWFGFLSHTGLSPMPPASGGQHTLVGSFLDRLLHFPSFCLHWGAPGPLLIPAQHRPPNTAES